MVFFIDPVGTLTACTMKVIPNRAITKVTTADSKYSRATLFLNGAVTSVLRSEARRGGDSTTALYWSIRCPDPLERTELSVAALVGSVSLSGVRVTPGRTCAPVSL